MVRILTNREARKDLVDYIEMTDSGWCQETEILWGLGTFFFYSPLEMFGFNLVTVDFIVKDPQTGLQTFRGFGLITVVLFQRFNNEFPLKIFNRSGQRKRFIGMPTVQALQRWEQMV